MNKFEGSGARQSAPANEENRGKGMQPTEKRITTRTHRIDSGSTSKRKRRHKGGAQRLAERWYRDGAPQVGVKNRVCESGAGNEKKGSQRRCGLTTAMLRMGRCSNAPTCRQCRGKKRGKRRDDPWSSGGSCALEVSEQIPTTGRRLLALAAAQPSVSAPGVGVCLPRAKGPREGGRRCVFPHSLLRTSR